MCKNDKTSFKNSFRNKQKLINCFFLLFFPRRDTCSQIINHHYLSARSSLHQHMWWGVCLFPSVCTSACTCERKQLQSWYGWANSCTHISCSFTDIRREHRWAQACVGARVSARRPRYVNLGNCHFNTFSLLTYLRGWIAVCFVSVRRAKQIC